MNRAYMFASVIAALLVGTTAASAQQFSDNPPGWAFQRRGIIEMNGGNPLLYGHRYYGWRGAYARAYGRHHYWRRHHWRW
jgi:hypothetical protein